MKTYTLNRLYHEGKALIEKYNLSDLLQDGYEYRVGFDIRERENKIPILSCSIIYDHKDYSSKRTSYVAFANTPAGCLNEFEEKLIKITGIVLLENVSVEINNE